MYSLSEVVNPSLSSSTQRVRDGNIEDIGGSFHGSDAGVGSVSSGSSGRRKNTDKEQTGSTQTPGSRAPEIPPVALIQCGQCSIDRPVTAAHCYECGVCVDELDHHCPVQAFMSCFCVSARLCAVLLTSVNVFFTTCHMSTLPRPFLQKYRIYCHIPT